MKTYLAIRLAAISSHLSVIHLRTHLGLGEKDSKNIIRKSLEIVEKESSAIGLDMTRIAARRLLVADFGAMNINEARNASNELAQRFHDEIEGVSFFLVSKEKMEMYQTANQFGDLVAQKYPLANHEATEAAKCFATGRYTASVFHLMRVLESALKSVAKGLGLPVPDKLGNWGDILKPIEKRMHDRTTANPIDPQWKAEKEFYQNAYAYLQGVRQMWRNTTMHFDSNYEEDGARDVFNAVSALMRHLATKLSE